MTNSSIKNLFLVQTEVRGESTSRWWGRSRREKKYTARNAFSDAVRWFILFPPSSPPNASHSQPPERDHHHIIGFKSRGRVGCPVGAGINHGNHWQNTEIMLPKSHLSAGRGLREADPGTARDVFPVARLNWFMCDLPKWIFIAFQVAI